MCKKEKLQKLIRLARKNKDQIVAINLFYDAYVAPWGIHFPDYKGEYQRQHEATEWMIPHVPMTEKHNITADTVGSITEWMKLRSTREKLMEHCWYGVWVSIDNEYLDSDEARVESGICSESYWTETPFIFYTNLNLPEDVAPNEDPFIQKLNELVSQG